MAVGQTSSSAHIRFSTSLLARLGEELNPSIDQSILELVKNSYDADAKNCTVILENITSEGGTLKVYDDGVGMNEDSIINGWLVLGASSKSAKSKTPGGRIPAGSKGLGRIAALRAGHIAELESSPVEDISTKFSLAINWDTFDKAHLVDDVILNIDKKSAAKGNGSGTSICIKQLKHKIGTREVKKIARGLILLADPFEDDPSAFKPILVSAEFKAIEELVSKRYFDEAEYHLNVALDGNGKAKAYVLDYLGNVLFEANHKELAGKDRLTYACPELSFDLWVFILSQSVFATRNVGMGEIQDWLKEFGGVHLYENGLRVNPYGNAGNDWLEMNLARTRSPEERPSTNTSIGVVRIKDSKGLLIQKTDRSGFIEDDVFFEIKAFCHDALEWMAKQRLAIAEKKRRAERERASQESTSSKETVSEVINKLRSGSQKAQLKQVFDRYERANQAQFKALKAEVQLYRTLSTAGITAATFSHESRGNPIKVITLSIKNIDRRIKEFISKKYDSHFLKPISSIFKSIDSLSVLGNVTLKLLENKKRRVVRVSIHSVINDVNEIFAPFFEGRDITVSLELAVGDPFLRASEAAVESIIANLINNSINALEDVTHKRCITIKTQVEANILILSVTDNGPGINGISIKNIWLPGQTTNPNGTGLGLTIVRDAAFDLGGNVRANAKSSLGGAEIIVELPIIGI